MKATSNLKRYLIVWLVTTLAAALITAGVGVPAIAAAVNGGNPVLTVVGVLFQGDIIENMTSVYPWMIKQPVRLVLLLKWLALVGLVIAACLAYSAMKTTQRDVPNGVFGRQRSITSRREILSRCYLYSEEEREHIGFVMGFVNGKYIVTPAVHFLAIAPSGSGKTRASVLPSLACVSESSRTNIVATDPSLEIWCYSRALLEKRGFETLLIDLVNPFRGARVNVIAPLVSMAKEGDLSLVEDRAMQIGSMIFPETGDKSDSFTRPAAGLLAAICYIVATDTGIDDSDRNLVSVIQTIIAGTVDDEGKALKDYLKARGHNDPAVSMAATFLTAGKEYLASIMGVLHDGLRPFGTRAMRYLLSGDDLNLPTFTTRRVAVFLHTLSPGAPGNKVASLILAQMWDVTVRTGERRGSNRETYYFLDEAHSIPPCGLVTCLEQGRKYNAHYGIYLQSTAGLDPYKTLAEDGKEAIIANCDAKALYRAGTVADAELFERLGGKKTVRAESIGESLSNRQSSTSTSYAEREVPVWMAGDILQRDVAKDGVLLFQNPTGHPEMSGKFEIPIKEISKTFLADVFGTIGTPEFEADVIAAELDLIEETGVAAKTAPIPVWTPCFEKETEQDEEGDEEADIFGI